MKVEGDTHQADRKIDQVLIREGPELGHKLANPVVRFVKSLIDPEAAGQTPSQVVEEELPKVREAVDRLPHLGILPTPISSDDLERRVV